MAIKISQMAEAPSLDGSELLELSRLSSTITITADTISALASDNSYNDSGDGFILAAFSVGDQVKVTGFTGDTANNIFSGKIQTLTAGKMVIESPAGDAIVNDSAGESVTIAKWETYRTTTQDVGDLGGGGGGGGADTTQTGEMMCGFISSPSEKDYRIVLKAAHGGTITETTTRSASGTCTATFKINTTALGGTANSVSSSESSQAHASDNAFSAGDDIVLTISSNSSCADLSFTIQYTRTLES